MTWNDHDHRGQYADECHDHYRDYAEYNHDHRDLESLIAGLREDLSRAQDRIRELEERDELDDALDRIAALEKQTPQARQLQLEADQAAADLAESGYDRHGRACQCSYCATDDEPDERGASEYHREEFALERPEEPW